MTDTGPVDVSGYADLHKRAQRKIMSTMYSLCKDMWVKSRGARTGSRVVLERFSVYHVINQPLNWFAAARGHA